MIVEFIKTGEQTKLYSKLDTTLRQFKRRNISYVITAHGIDVATIIISITGRQGTIQKTMVLLLKEENWEIYYDDIKAILMSFSEVKTVIQKMISSTNPILSKI